MAFTIDFALSPMAAVPIPKKIEKTTMGNISLLAMASITLFGITWVMNSRNEGAPLLSPSLNSSAGSGNFITNPGSKIFTNTSPKLKAKMVAPWK